MPILWWYLLKNYLKVLALAVFSFVAILLISRLEEIAGFAAMGAQARYLMLFTLYQIPYILPVAIPISCLISAMLLFQRLSHTHELTALRASGIALKKIVTPVLLAAVLIATGTFYIASELATSSHLATRKMVHDLSSVNPLLLLQSAKIARLQDAFVQLDPVRNGESADNLVIAVNNTSGKRLNVCLAKHVAMEKGQLVAKDVSLISSSESDEARDHLIIENQQIMSSSAPEFAKLLRKTGWKIANDHLKWSLLRIRSQMLKKEMAAGGNVTKNLNKCRSEIIRRISCGLAVFTFTLLGTAFGMEISRNRSRRGIIWVIGLTASCLICFFAGKEFDHLVWAASLLFLLPHAVLVFASLWTFNHINTGIE